MAPRPPKPGNQTQSSSTQKAWVKVVDRSTSVTEFHPEIELKDGNVSITVPEDITRDAPPLWKNFVIGHFVGPVPHIGKIHAIVNKIWVTEGKTSKIDVNFLTTTAALFRIDDDVMRKVVLNRAFWHIAETPLIVHEWNPENAQKKLELTTIPLWVDFINVPGHLFSVKGLSYLASVIGRPIRLHPTTEKCTRLDVARVLVEVDLTKPLHKQISVQGDASATKNIVISYPWLPPRCGICLKWGHDEKTCPEKNNGGKLKTVEKVQEINHQESPKESSTPKASQSISVINPQMEAMGSFLETQNILQTSVPELGIVPTDSLRDQEYPPLPSKPQGESELAVADTNIWQVIKRDPRRSGSRSPYHSSPQSSHECSPTSPSRFGILAKVREEGEIDEDDEEDKLDDEEISVDAPETSTKKNGKGKAPKLVKKIVVRSRDIALARASSVNLKKASLRKH